MALAERPVDPPRAVVLAVRVVVSTLGARNSFPASSIGTPLEIARVSRKFLIWRARTDSIADTYV
jgi:hypothetical protein